MNENSSKPEIYYLLADRWFRIIEFSLIIATLNYFSIKIDSNILKCAYWVSWFMFFNWFLELGEFIGNKIYKGTSVYKKILIGFLVMIPFIAIFIFLTKVSAMLVTLEK